MRRSLFCLLLFIWSVLQTLVVTSDEFYYPLTPPGNKQIKPSGDITWLPTGYIGFTNKISATDISKDGTLLALGDEEGYVELFDFTTFTSLWRKQIYKEGIPVKIVRLDPQKELVAASGGYYPAKSLPLFILNTADGSTALQAPPEKSPSPDCAATGNTLDPQDIRWAPTGSTLYILYDGHKLANTGGCMVAAEKYLYLRNLETGDVDIQTVSLDPFSQPEGDEPDYPWIMERQFMNISPDGKTISIASGNSRICQYNTNAHTKLSLARISKSLYLWTDRLGVSTSGNGTLCLDRAGNIYTLLGKSGMLATTRLVKLSPTLNKLEVLSYVEEPYPVVQLTADERYLLVSGQNLHLWDLSTRTALYHGPWGSINGTISLLHPVKRAILMVVSRRIHLVIERPAVRFNLTGQWKKTGRFVNHFDSFYIAGDGPIGVGYGDWLREDWQNNAAFYNEGYSELQPDDDDLNEEGELSFRTKKPGLFVLYGGRSPAEGNRTEDLWNSIQNW